MLQALVGFVTVWVVIGVGWLAAHLGFFTDGSRRFMQRTAFVIASPALLLMMVSRADLGRLFTGTLVVSVLAVVVTAGVYVLVASLVFKRTVSEQVIGAMSSCYTNAANIGLPIAFYVLGDVSWIAPILLLQVGILQPIALMILDSQQVGESDERPSVFRHLSLPFRNPITVGVLIGMVLALLKIEVPVMIAGPLDTIGGMTVPMMLMAFGISLRLDPLPGKGPHMAELWTVQAFKLILHPLAALALGAWVFHLDTPSLLAVTVMGALSSATNIYVIAGRYGVAERLARDAIFWSTILC
ncbi:MAG TPA: AEC family transporter, partial [Propionibacteriaceae bacterium]|nr:AEC family transporter [Propionibacteriaceae bacterium]